MKRIAVIADSHFSEESRWEECLRLHHWIAIDIRRRGVDLILHAGDVFDKRSRPRERLTVAAWLTDLAAIAPVVVVRGNHDAIEDLSLFANLKTLHPIVVEEKCGVHHQGGCAVACLAWPRRAELLRASVGSEAGSEVLAGEALRSVLRGMGDELAVHAGPRILLAHAMVRGSLTSAGQPLVGCDMEIGVEDLALSRADFIALGHIHKGQDWQWGGATILYPGSPRRTAFGEIEDKGYTVVEIDSTPPRARDGAAPATTRWQRIAAPATPMLHIDEDWTPDHAWQERSALCHARGAEIRFRYRVDADRRDSARHDAERLRTAWLARGAIAVKLEEVVRATGRARAPEIATASTLEEKLRVLWCAKGIDVGNDRATRLLAKIAEGDGA